MWVLALVLTTSMVFTACSEKNDDPNEEVEQGKVVVDPENVFVNGLPKSIGDYTIDKNSKDQVVFIYNQKEKEYITFEYKNKNLGATEEPNVVMAVENKGYKMVYNLFLNKYGYVRYCDAIEYNTSNNIYTEKIDFEYNKDRQLTKIVETVGGYKTTSSITYKNGDAIETSEVSQKEGKETAHCKIYYTSDKVTSPIENKGCIMDFAHGLGLGNEDLAFIYYAGMLGKPTKHLPIFSIDLENNKSTFSWALNSKGFPTSFIRTYNNDKYEYTIVW